jgi:hypothetical protein
VKAHHDKEAAVRAMPDLISKQYHHVAHGFLVAALSKARTAQDQLWDHGPAEPGSALRKIESLSSILIAWLAIEGMINEAFSIAFDDKSTTGAKHPLMLAEKLEQCVVQKLGAERWGEYSSLRARFHQARNFRNRLVHYSSSENPSEPRWEGRDLPAGMGVAWFVGGPPTRYKEGLMEQIDPERAWEFCSVALEISQVVYVGLGLAPAIGEILASFVVDPMLLPHKPTLSGLMAGIPIWQVERYVRALRVAEQYPDEWWVLDPNGRRRPYRPGDDLKPETILTAFEGEPTEESLAEYWQEYWDALSPLAVRTKVLRRLPSGDWCLEWPAPRPMYTPEPDGDPE